VLDEVVAGVLDGRDEIEVERLAALPPALARLVVRRLAEGAVGRAVPRAARRTGDVLALGADGALDLGDGARARVRAGTLRFEATPAGTAHP
jgi:tRNA(Ile)-lysidine synthase